MPSTVTTLPHCPPSSCVGNCACGFTALSRTPTIGLAPLCHPKRRWTKAPSYGLNWPSCGKRLPVFSRSKSKSATSCNPPKPSCRRSAKSAASGSSWQPSRTRPRPALPNSWRYCKPPQLPRPRRSSTTSCALPPPPPPKFSWTKPRPAASSTSNCARPAGRQTPQACVTARAPAPSAAATWPSLNGRVMATRPITCCFRASRPWRWWRPNAKTSMYRAHCSKPSATAARSAPARRHSCMTATGASSLSTAFLLCSPPMAGPICGSWPPKAASGFVTCAKLKTVARPWTAGTAPMASKACWPPMLTARMRNWTTRLSTLASRCGRTSKPPFAKPNSA